ncbi:hypothetical protein COD66_24665 [Bacillus cereus]|nr:hypothetical protein COD66_24665 [Bacillus cereus]
MIVKSVSDAFKAASDAGGLLMKAFRWLIPVTEGQTFAQAALNTATRLFPGVWIAAAIAGVVAAGILLWKNWDFITAVAKNMWKIMKQEWSEGTQRIEKAYNDMKRGASDWWADTSNKWDNMVNKVSTESAKMYNSAVTNYESMKSEAKRYLSGMVDDATNNFNSMVDSAWAGASYMWDAGVANAKNFTTGAQNNLNNLGNIAWKGMRSMWEGFWGWSSDLYNSGKGLLNSFTNGVINGFNGAIDAVYRGMKSIRQYLPFSPAKKGPLSDLDKLGEAFFPTWYNAAMTQVGSMQKAIGGAFSGVANEADVALAGTGLGSLHRRFY